jgi:hypothetical protein
VEKLQGVSANVKGFLRKILGKCTKSFVLLGCSVRKPNVFQGLWRNEMIESQVHEMAEKIPFSHDIDGDVKDLFDRAAEELPGNKYEILEAMIRAFAALPRMTRIMIIAGNTDRPDRPAHRNRHRPVAPSAAGAAAAVEPDQLGPLTRFFIHRFRRFSQIFLKEYPGGESIIVVVGSR